MRDRARRRRLARDGLAAAAALAAGVVAAGPAAAAHGVPGRQVTPRCEVAQTSTAADGSWGQLRLGAERAWPLTRGAGQLVAVVSSGVDAAVPALSGRVRQGVDLADGSSGGRRDCAGNGTAMAGMLVAHGTAAGADNDGVSGIAPDSSILPVYMDRTGGDEGQAGAAAIRVALTARADVIVFDEVGNLDAPAAAAELSRATASDVVVVVPSTALGGTLPAGVVAVSAVGIDGRVLPGAGTARPAVLAPGVGVDAVGITGVGSLRVTGHQFAAAYVAGEVALLRSRHPRESASSIVTRVVQTSNTMKSGRLIDPVAAVRATTARPAVTRPVAAAAPAAYRAPTWALMLAGLFGAVLIGLMGWWARHLVVARRADPTA